MANSSVYATTTREHSNIETEATALGGDPQSPWQLQSRPAFEAILKDPDRLAEPLATFKPFVASVRSRNVDIPTLFWVMRWGGISSVSSFYRRYAIAMALIFMSSQGVVLMFSFHGYGTPLPLAIGLGLPYLFLGYANAFVFYNYCNTTWFVQSAIASAPRWEAAARKTISPFVIQQIVYALVIGALVWSSLVPQWSGSDDALVVNSNSTISTGTIPPLYQLIPIIIFSTAYLQPPMHFIGLFATISLTCTPHVQNSMVDTYASALLATLSDKESDKETKLDKINILYKNFTRRMSVHATPQSAHSANFLAYVGLLLGIISSIISVVVGVPEENTSNMLGRRIIGILNTLLLMGYLVGFLNNSITASRRWEYVCRTHFTSPIIIQKALELGAWSSALDFKSWLLKDHDLREYVFGVLVDHRAIWQLGAGLGSSVAVVVGYGMLSIMGMNPR